MKQLHFFLSTLLLVVFVACGDDSNEYKIGGKTGEDTPVQPDERQSAGPEIAKYNLEFPALKGGNSIVVVHSGVLNDTYNKSGVNYSVEWDTSLRAQRWSCYQMYADSYKSGSQVIRLTSNKIQGNTFWFINPRQSIPERSRITNTVPVYSRSLLEFWLRSWSYLSICRPPEGCRSQLPNFLLNQHATSE